MKTVPFLEYLHEHLETRVLAEELAGLLILRGRPDLIPKAAQITDLRRIAS